MRILKRGFSDLVIFYLVGSHLDERLRSCLPRTTIVAFSDQGLSPNDVAEKIGMTNVKSLVLVGYSAGCQAVRSALLSSSLPKYDRLGVVCVDGTHASIPPERWQIEVWSKIGHEARRGEKLCVATCTNNIYTARLDKPFMPTIAVMNAAFEPALFPSTPPHEVHAKNLHLYAYDSDECDRDAHIRQQTEALPMVLEKHVRPWLVRAAVTRPDQPPAIRALNVARGYVGQKETGPNLGSIVRASMAGCIRDGRPLGIRDGVPWCAGFIGLCDHEAGAQQIWRASVRELVSDAVVARMWRELGEYEPQPGDLAVFRRGNKDPRDGVDGHVERVEVAPDASGMLTTIGGNVGDAVVRRTWRIGEEDAGHELVGWICRTGFTQDEEARIEAARFISLEKLRRGVVEV